MAVDLGAQAIPSATSDNMEHLPSGGAMDGADLFGGTDDLFGGTDDLFGGGDDLFGDGDAGYLFGHLMQADPPSLATPGDATESCQELAQSMPLPLPLISPLPLPKQTSLPTAQLEDISSQLAPALPLPSLPLATVPDPPGAALLPRDGHTSGGFVVSTRTSTAGGDVATSPSLLDPAPVATFQDEGDEWAELEALWHATPVDEDQAVNVLPRIQTSPADPADQQAPTGGPDHEEGETILVADIQGFHFGNAKVNRGRRLPRRIDTGSARVEMLVPYLTFHRKTRLDELYDRLELQRTPARFLVKEIKKCLQSSPVTLSGEDDQIPLTNFMSFKAKTALTRAAFKMLCDENIGNHWFGRDRKNVMGWVRVDESSVPPTKFWPEDSTIITLHFISLVHRVMRIDRQARTRATKDPDEPAASQAASSATSLDVASYTSPLDAGSCTSSSDRASGALPSPVEGEFPLQQLPQPKPRRLFDSMVAEASMTKKRKRFCHEEMANGNDATTAPRATLVYEVEVPDDAQLIYNVHVREASDGSNLSSSITFRHTDNVIARGAFTYLKYGFEKAGHIPVVEILMPDNGGRRRIDSERAWDSAVLTVYNAQQGMGWKNVVVDVVL